SSSTKIASQAMPARTASRRPSNGTMLLCSLKVGTTIVNSGASTTTSCATRWRRIVPAIIAIVHRRFALAAIDNPPRVSRSWRQEKQGAEPMRRTFLAAIIAATLTAPVARAEPVTIKAAWAAVPGQMFPILMQMKDVLVHYGKSYTVQAIRAPGSGPQTTALATGDISLAYFSPAAFALAIQNAHMNDLRVIGVATRDGYQDYFTRPFAVLGNSPIKKVEDLKGKVIGDNSIGGAMDIGMRAMLKRHGLEDKRDYT